MKKRRAARDEPDDFVKKVMSDQAARQADAVRPLGPDGRAMISSLNGYFWKVILIAGKCLKERHHPLLMRLLLGRFDDLIALDRRPGGAIMAGVAEIQEACEKRMRQQGEEIRRERLRAEDARDVETVAGVLMDLALGSARLMPSRFVFMSLAREQIKDMMTLLGIGRPGSGILDLPFRMN